MQQTPVSRKQSASRTLSSAQHSTPLMAREEHREDCLAHRRQEFDRRFPSSGSRGTRTKEEEIWQCSREGSGPARGASFSSSPASFRPCTAHRRHFRHHHYSCRQRTCALMPFSPLQIVFTSLLDSDRSGFADIGVRVSPGGHPLRRACRPVPRTINIRLIWFDESRSRYSYYSWRSRDEKLTHDKAVWACTVLQRSRLSTRITARDTVCCSSVW